MRKQLIKFDDSKKAGPDAEWLMIEGIATVEITSEDPTHPIEPALLPGGQTDWRAEQPGPQVIRLRFDRPHPLSRIRVEFNERRLERTQEYVLRWSDEESDSLHEIVRQQWNFSSPGATREIEEHHVELPAVAVLELMVIPDISGGSARASLSRLLLA